MGNVRNLKALVVSHKTVRKTYRDFLSDINQGIAISALAWLLVALLPTLAVATHDADHRFTVEGYVCGADGSAVSEEKVIIKNTKAKVSKAVFTDGEGYYKATLHLHNDNVGDPLLISVKGQEQKAKVEFDPKDLESERGIQVNFGQGCEKEGVSPSLLIVLGLVGVVLAVGITMLKLKKKRPQGKTKGKRK